MNCLPYILHALLCAQCSDITSQFNVSSVATQKEGIRHIKTNRKPVPHSN